MYIKFKALNTPKYKIIPFLHMGNMNVCDSKINTQTKEGISFLMNLHDINELLFCLCIVLEYTLENTITVYYFSVI